eukprot:scaffold3190_cov409-Prasinococcus_capsulatus_cf.AAC.22
MSEFIHSAPLQPQSLVECRLCLPQAALLPRSRSSRWLVETTASTCAHALCATVAHVTPLNADLREEDFCPSDAGEKLPRLAYKSQALCCVTVPSIRISPPWHSPAPRPRRCGGSLHAPPACPDRPLLRAATRPSARAHEQGAPAPGSQSSFQARSPRPRSGVRASATDASHTPVTGTQAVHHIGHSHMRMHS